METLSSSQRQKILILAAAAALFFQFHLFVVKRIDGRAHGHYDNYNTGVTFIDVGFMDAGPVNPNAKWLVECFDGQALVGLRSQADFESLATIKCRTAFPGKPSTHGYYPYYERCQVRNITHKFEFRCFDPQNYPNSINTFITGYWDDDDSFLIYAYRTVKPYIGSAFKCCATPPGYEIDYTACQTRYTHNEFYEFYDTTFFVMECPDTFVMTGIGTAVNPHDAEVHFDWIQCCPLIYSPTPAFRSQQLFGEPGLDSISFLQFQHVYAFPSPEIITMDDDEMPATTPTPPPTMMVQGVNVTAMMMSGSRANAAFGVQLMNSREREQAHRAGNDPNSSKMIAAAASGKAGASV